MTDGTIQWGIIGCGNVTEVKSGPALQKAKGSALVAVMRRTGELARDYAQRHGVPRWYDNADALIADPQVQAVYVATPPGSHLEYALKVAAAGKPCYVEKPMARSHGECERMVEAFAIARQPLFVAYYRRCLPRFIVAKELIDTGRLGQITSINYRHSRLHRPSPNPEWRLDVRESGGGLLLDLGSHALDLFDHLLGPLTQVAGSAANFSDHTAEDAVAMSFATQCGAIGTASWNFATSTIEDDITIDGTKARLMMTCFGNEPLRLRHPDGTVESFDHPNPPHVQQPLIQTIVDQLLGQGACPSTGESAARTSRVMDIVLSDYYGGRDDAFWDRPQSWPGRRANPAPSPAT